ncbi:MAG: type II CAAX prenyl endopeptidase Rce1 family protein [Halanaerobium sp.]
MQNNIFSDQRLNYKDFLIVIASWYFITLSSYYIIEKDFTSLIYINEILAFAINVLSHIVFLFIIYSYFNLLYDFSFADLGFKFKKEKINFKELFIIFIFLTAGVILINLNYQPEVKSSFFPLQLGENIFKILYSDLPLLIMIFIILLFTASVEQFLFNKIIFSLFNLYLPGFLAIIFSGLFASILFLEFNPAFILIIFISVVISNYLYISSDYNLFTPIIFYSYFLTLYIVFIYGFDFVII